MDLSYMSSPPPTRLIEPENVVSFTPPLSKNTHKEPHLAKIATRNWRQKATSKAKTSQKAQKAAKIGITDNQGARMPGHQCLLSA